MKRLLLAVVSLAIAVAAHAQSGPSLHVAYDSTYNRVLLYLTPVSGSTYYRITRSPGGTGWPQITNQYLIADANVPAGVAYVYQAAPADLQGNVTGPAGNKALASTYAFTDPQITAGTTAIKAVHVTELRTALGGAASAAGAAPPTWTHATLTPGTSRVYAADVQELRTALDQTFAAMAISPLQAYVDATLNSTVPIKRVHIEQIRQRVRAFPLQLNVNASVSQRYFSPNSDGQKDTSAISGTVADFMNAPQTDLRWIVNVRNGAGAVVRTSGGNGSPFTYSWDGRNGAGAVQPEGDYTFELVDADGLAAPLWTATTTIDLTNPVATLTGPTEGAMISNVHSAGSTIVAVTGSATDAHIASWVVERVGNNQGTAGIASGTTNATAGSTFANWNTAATMNGTYTVRLTAADQAGNTAISSVNVQIGNFSVTVNAHQLNAAGAGTVTFTSIVPFTSTEAIVLKAADGTTVRTISPPQRAAGTYADVWDGKNDQGLLVGDGAYKFTATTADASGSFTWDDTAPVGTDQTQYQYPLCRNAGSSTRYQCSDPALVFDPYGNKPLRINFCVGDSQHTPPNCVAGTPRYVVVKASTYEEDGGACDTGCISFGYVAGGEQEVTWWGASAAHAYIGNLPRLVVLRTERLFAGDLVVVFGTAPTVSNVTIDKPLFYPNGSPLTITLNLQTFQARTVTIKAEIRNVGTILRTITTSPSAAATQTILWNGRAENGAWVAPGVYELTLTITDSAGGVTTLQPYVTVKY